MENKFLVIKEAFIELLKDKDPCKPEYRKVLESETEEQLLDVIKNNLNWCSVKGVCPDSFLLMFSPEKILNSGVANVGEGNTGLANTGAWNTGDRNTGDRNTGDRNTGDSNTGAWNTGAWNTGYSNTGDRNTGAFCIGEAPFPIFNKPSDWTAEQFRTSKAYELLCQVDTKQWVPSSHMSEEEKTKYPSHATAEGYLKDIPFKESFQNAWHNWSTSSRQAFIDLPNFNAEIFFEITGVKID